MALAEFHRAVAGWFERSFADATPCQREAWPAIQAGRHVLIAAPTGSGKTLAAFLAAIDGLVREGLACGGLPDQTRVLYVSPLKALSNDIQKNLQAPLAGVRDRLFELGLPDVDVRAWVRTGDTPAGERERMRRKPPHIVVTTPESLYILLTSESGRRMLSTVGTVIIDEIHALAGNKRGAHLALSLERLDALCGKRSPRIGLSATQKPIDTVARFLTGRDGGACHIVDSGHVRERDMALVLPRSPLEAVMSGEVWGEVYDRLAELIGERRTTLVFVNTRRVAERVARHLAERLGDEAVATHHGSLAREQRLDAEQRLKRGQLQALVATSSLELGIDIGDVDLVCQLGSPRAIGAFVQRVGRSGHAVDGTPCGRLFPLSRDDLVECTALLDAVHRGELDCLSVPERPLDVLAQQIVAEVACRDWSEAELYAGMANAWPYRALDYETYLSVVRMLAEGFSTRRGRRSAYLHRDAVNGQLRARRGARLTAITNGGAIPDQFDYDVILEPEEISVGTLNEDFAFESLPGDIFQLGNTSYRIVRVAGGTVRVHDAKGQPPNIPFWFGEAPGRTDALSLSVSRLREAAEQQLVAGESLFAWLSAMPGVGADAATQLADYLGASHAALGLLPTHSRLVLERFFDDVGDMHLVLHAPFGSRINRALGLALRKRFCRRFNFELQAAALEDSVVLSLGPTHSFDLEEVIGYLNAKSVRDVLVQALLDAPMFPTHWRWVASIALAVRRNRNGRKLPAQFQRSDAEDLVAVVFPDQLACLENIAGRREIPDHPLVTQAIDDCLHDVMDVDGLERLLRALDAGEVSAVARDLSAPSPLSQEILTARPYAFLDDAPAEERRTLSVSARAGSGSVLPAEPGRIDPASLARVVAEAWPEVRDAEELHDALLVAGWLTASEAQGCGWARWFEQLCANARATVATTPAGVALWVATERLPVVQAVFPALRCDPRVAVPAEFLNAANDPDAALAELVRGRLEIGGPLVSADIAATLGVGDGAMDAAFVRLEAEGMAVRGRFTGDERLQWCERGLLARMHRYTVERLRREIEPVSAADFMRFLIAWQRAEADGGAGAGRESLLAVLGQLEGFEAPAGVWETDLLPLRVAGYDPAALDGLCLSGRTQWLRLALRAGHGGGSLRSVPIAWIERGQFGLWREMAGGVDQSAVIEALSGAALRLVEAMRGYGALFFDELADASGLLRSQVETALGELVGAGLASSDSFAGMRGLLSAGSRRRTHRRRGGGGAPAAEAGRWQLLRPLRPTQSLPSSPSSPAAGDPHGGAAVEYVARVLLRRYGVVTRRVLEREPHWLPPWRLLLGVYRRLEARGEVRGGRFVAAMAGEQFALPEAVGLLRDARRGSADIGWLAISAADPLNLVGIVTPGERIPVSASRRILLRDGVPVALQQGRDVRFLERLGERAQWDARNALLRRVTSPLSGFAQRQ